MRTEEILAAIETQLTGLTTTGTNVQRAETYDIQASNVPALIIAGAEDVVEDQLMQSFIDWKLTVYVDILARDLIASLVSTLNTARGEVHAALMSNYNLLPLDYVKFIEAVSTDAPNISVDGDMPVARQRLIYTVSYRTNWANFN